MVAVVTPIVQGVTVESANQITLGVGTAMLAAGVIIITGSIVVVLVGIILWSRRKRYVVMHVHCWSKIYLLIPAWSNSIAVNHC